MNTEKAIKSIIIQMENLSLSQDDKEETMMMFCENLFSVAYYNGYEDGINIAQSWKVPTLEERLKEHGIKTE